jgi:hypothetical protein
MTVKELKHIIDSQLKAMPRFEDWEVVISTEEPSVGSSSSVPARSAGFGFDWDNGKFFVYPKEDLVKKDKKPVGQLVENKVIMESEEGFGFKPCDECGEKAWDGYICHNCGSKNI